MNVAGISQSRPFQAPPGFDPVFDAPPTPQARAEAIIDAIDTAPVAERAALARDIAASLDDAALGELAGTDEGRAALRALGETLANAPGGIVDAPAQQQRIDAALQAANGGGVSFDAQVRGREAKAIDLELAQIAQAVYDPSTRSVGDWTRLSDDQLRAAGIDPATLENPKTGFRAGIYSDGDGRYVLAFAGSNDLQDWLDNIRQGVGLDAAQYKQAVDLARDAERAFGDELVITGHSLGGGLAATASLATGNAAVTFNAAGVHDATLERFDIADGTAAIEAAAAKARAESGQIRHYAVDGESLTTEQETDLIVSAILPDAIGHKITLSDPHPLGIWERLNPYEVIIDHPADLHAMDSVIDALNEDRPWDR